MNTPLPKDGCVDEDLPSDRLSRPQMRDGLEEKPTGFSDAAVDFRFEHAAAYRGRTKSQRSLDETRRQVENLLKDAGVAPPRDPDDSPWRADPVVDTALQDGARPTQQFVPDTAEARYFKRGFDVVVATLAFICFAPLMGLIALALMLEGGPVFYRQTRIGRAYKRFACIKFRTMRPDAEDRLNLLLACNDAARAEWRVHQKLVNDPRVTRLGRLLRESSLDELPQLINVLRGEMSLVGPRPIVAPEIPGYDADRAYFGSVAFDDYTACLPGITGLWQVSGRHKTIYLDRVRLDREYARTWSVWLDLKILWKTLGVVLRRSGR